MEYIIVLVILLIGVLIYGGRPYTKASDRWLLFEWLVVVLIAGLRYKVGGDTQTYFDEYQNWPSLAELSDFISTDEFGRYNVLWVLLMSFFKSITNDFVYFQIIHAIFINTSFFLFFRNRSKNVFIIILLYFFLYFFWYNTEALRAAICVAIFLFSFQFLEQRKWGKYFLLGIIALGFHSEAFIVFLFPFFVFFKKIRITSRSFWKVCFVAALLLFVNLSPLINSLFSYSEKVSTNVGVYVDQSELGKGVSFLGYLKTFIWNFIWLYILRLIGNKPYSIIKPFLLFHFFMSIITLNYSNMFLRMMDFTKPIALLAIGDVLYDLKIKHENTRLVILSLMIILLFIDQILYFANGHIILFYPYTSVFDPIEYPAREIYYNDFFSH